jgi:hypothetical protein
MRCARDVREVPQTVHNVEARRRFAAPKEYPNGEQS